MRRCLLGFVLAVAWTAPLPAADVDFAGRWEGKWKNSDEQKGDSKLELKAEGRGKFSGVWDGIKVTGERANGNTLELRGRTATGSYQMTCTVVKGQMTILYLVARLNDDGAYHGVAVLEPK